MIARIGIGAKIGVGYGYKKSALGSIGLPYRGRVKIDEEIQFFRRVKWERTRHQRLTRQVWGATLVSDFVACSRARDFGGGKKIGVGYGDKTQERIRNAQSYAHCNICRGRALNLDVSD